MEITGIQNVRTDNLQLNTQNALTDLIPYKQYVKIVNIYFVITFCLGGSWLFWQFSTKFSEMCLMSISKGTFIVTFLIINKDVYLSEFITLLKKLTESVTKP